MWDITHRAPASLLRLTIVILLISLILPYPALLFAQEVETEATTSETSNTSNFTSVNPETTNTAPKEEDTKEPELGIEPIPPDGGEQLLSGEDPYVETQNTKRVELPEPDQATGALIYEFPIAIPPGRNEMHPDLRLQYNSQDRKHNGVFGFGWSASIPYIERINKSGVNNLYNEQYFYSSLSGELGTTTDSTIYGAKIDAGDFFEYHLENNVWTAYDKQGIQYIFGSTTDSRLDNPSEGSEIFRWMITEIRDTKRL